jgi:hypothetical protein
MATKRLNHRYQPSAVDRATRQFRNMDVTDTLCSGGCCRILELRAMGRCAGVEHPSGAFDNPNVALGAVTV